MWVAACACHAGRRDESGTSPCCFDISCAGAKASLSQDRSVHACFNPESDQKDGCLDALSELVLRAGLGVLRAKCSTLIFVWTL